MRLGEADALGLARVPLEPLPVFTADPIEDVAVEVRPAVDRPLGWQFQGSL